MGARKRNRAEQRKAEKKSKAIAILHSCPTSPRKMRLVADMIRGQQINKALDMLKFSTKDASRRMEKLVLSAVANWQSKNQGSRIEDSDIVVKEIFVDASTMLKRIQPAPQGRAYRVRKRSNHVTVVLGNANSSEEVETVEATNMQTN
jgi:large subunit ribosomal protein L22